MNNISLDAAVALTGMSRSTLWRRVTDGTFAKGEKDARGRATLALADVLALLREATGLTFAGDDAALLLQADAGDAAAQADIGALLAVSGAEKAALYWLHEAAGQGSADAMQWLGAVCAAAANAGEATQREQSENLAIMWIAKAAAQGHAVALRQMSGLRGRG